MDQRAKCEKYCIFIRKHKSNFSPRDWDLWVGHMCSQTSPDIMHSYCDIIDYIFYAVLYVPVTSL